MGLLDRLFGSKKPPKATAIPGTAGEQRGTTFSISNVSAAADTLPEVPYHQAVTDFLGGPSNPARAIMASWSLASVRIRSSEHST